MGLVVAGSLLLAIFLVIVAALVWQEARRGRFAEPPVYVMDDAVRYVEEHLPAETAARLTPDGVRKILEWEVAFLQRPEEGIRVVGGPRSIRHIRARASEEQGVEYREEDIRLVLEREGGYLESIGAVAGPVRGQGDS